MADLFPSMMINGSSKVLGIFGDPVEHTLSPKMQNAIIQDLGLNYVYVPFQVTELNLEKATQAIRSLNIRGVNITIPHKVSIMQFLDDVDETALKIGSVNTIKNENNKLIGRNTDGEGCLQAIEDTGMNLNNKNVIILGAGGAAKAIAFYLAQKINKITIINRSPTKMQTLVNNLRNYYDIQINGILFDQKNELKKALDEADLLINTTSVGMSPNIEKCPIEIEFLHPELFVNDIVYNPLHTQLLQNADQIGCKTLSGVEMLVNQGAIGFEWWTGKKPNKKLMKKIVLQHLLNHK
ncbi:Shikimate dehydrogenase (NADP(+)) [Candidatus Lokiarchaeum ossiferum]|uniref:Shikimate dehydrogenase (NADP(+)) n=1 Tax=Candidatus Lokiarchaeum ossiferum TaxID=2951803 RepID=A0ABY6HY53_9ARCH|nr:Shikimate dehydrogenase (NADP(+)) [Candidatus Lokiarchaeum sp. B-35]